MQLLITKTNGRIAVALSRAVAASPLRLDEGYIYLYEYTEKYRWTTTFTLLFFYTKQKQMS